MTEEANFRFPKKFRPLFEPARYKGMYGGRSSAKSHTAAAALLLIGLKAPTRILCAREVQRSIRDSVKRLLDDKIRTHGLGWFYESTDAEIRGANGTLFVFAGLKTNPETIMELEGIDIAWVDQAQRMSRKSIEILIPTIRKEGSELWFTWNPSDPSDPIDVILRQQKPDDAWVEHFTFRDNPFLPETIKREIERDRKRDPAKYMHIWEGEYETRGHAQVFANWRIEEFEPPEDVVWRQGADWGFSVDPTVLVRCYVNEKERQLYIYDEAYEVGCEIDRTPALFRRVPDSDKWPTIADSARPETISYMQRQGFNMRGAKKGAGSVEEGIEFLKSYDIVVHPQCKRTIDELHYFRYKTDPHTGDVLPVLEDKHNHVIDALRYAIEPVIHSGGGATFDKRYAIVAGRLESADFDW